MSPAALAARLLRQAEALPCWPLLFISRAGPQRLPGSQPGQVNFVNACLNVQGFYLRTIQLKFQRLLAELSKQTWRPWLSWLLVPVSLLPGVRAPARPALLRASFTGASARSGLEPLLVDSLCCIWLSLEGPVGRPAVAGAVLGELGSRQGTSQLPVSRWGWGDPLVDAPLNFSVSRRRTGQVPHQSRGQGRGPVLGRRTTFWFSPSTLNSH